jgi:ubiquinone biosynthesis protein
MDQLLVALASNWETRRKTQEVEAILDQIGPGGRHQLAEWTGFTLPIETLVPPIYAAWRPLVRDALRFVVSRLSPARLAPKLTEQAELPADTPVEKRLMKLIARMPGLQKLGQVLARNRYLDERLRAELTLLENGMLDAGYEEIRTVLNAELGHRQQEYSVEIEPAIFSEASVSAVVRFTWWNAATQQRERGVFKVLKPHIRACFAEDLAIFRELADRVMENADLAGTLNEVCDLLAHEVNFRQEQDTLERAARVYSGVAGVRVPQLIRELCSDSVTAMTEESGVKVVEVFADRPVLRRQVAEQIVAAVIAAPLFLPSGDLLFHADPHAGNMLYDEQTRELILLDWALSGTLGEEQVRQVALLLLMLTLRDPAGVIAAIDALSEGGVTGAITGQVTRFIAAQPWLHVPGSTDAMRLLDQLALQGVRFPAPLLMFRKVLFTLDGILHELAGADLSLDRVILGGLAEHWVASLGALRLPLTMMDVFSLQCSAAFYGSRLWLQAASEWIYAWPLQPECGQLHEISAVSPASLQASEQ